MTMLPPDPIYIFKGEMDSISSLAFKITLLIQRLFAGTQSGNVHVWDLKNKREVGKFKVGDDTCISICIPEEEEENAVVTHSKAGDISFWRERDREWVLTKSIKVDFFGFCKCTMHEGILYVPLRHSNCECICAKTGETLKRMRLGNDESCEMMALKVCVVGGRRRLLVASEARELVLWDADDAERLSDLPLEECPMAVDYDDATNKGLCGDPTRKMIVFSFDRNLKFEILKKVTLTNAGVAAVKIRPDGKLVAVGCWDGKLRLYSWKTLVLLAALDVHSSTVQEVAFSRKHSQGSESKYLLAAGSQDSKLSLWDLYN